MNWWVLMGDTSYRQISFLNYDDDSFYLEEIDKAASVARQWAPRRARYSTDELEKDLPAGDFATMCYEYPVLNQRALDILDPLIASCVEMLPLLVEDSTFYLINVAAVDCLDHERSEFTYFQSGNIDIILRYEFSPGCLDGKHIFRLPEKNYALIYVSDVFKDTVEESALTGLSFRPAFEYEGNLQEHSK